MSEYVLTDNEFRLFRDLTYHLTGIALTEGKRQLVQGRLQKRMRHYGFSRFQEYYALLMQVGPSGAETTEFINCITTNKTDFFREAHHFQFVAETVIPEQVRRVRRGEIPPCLRVWHAGCSTGEEPYTLGITLSEALDGHGEWDVRQLASDIDTKVLEHAERGVYEEDRVHSVPDKLLRKYFLRGREDNAHLVKACSLLRERITFRQINLLADNWPIRPGVQFDMIFCRNVVIYFDKPTQRKLFARFQERLRPGGYLFIGHSESLLGISDAYDSLGKTIYRLPEDRVPEAMAA